MILWTIIKYLVATVYLWLVFILNSLVPILFYLIIIYILYPFVGATGSLFCYSVPGND